MPLAFLRVIHILQSKLGIYKLRLVNLYASPENSFFRRTIVVSVCPDDFDEDGINDNIDLDLDNDGILNSYESVGKGVIDFTNIEAPVISLPNGATDLNSARTKPAVSASASISGSADGVFKTALQATGVVEEVEFILLIQF